MNNLRQATIRHCKWMSTLNSPQKSAVLFPGQGSQHVGMGKDLYDKYPIAKQVFEEANEGLGFSLSSLIFEGQEDVLTLTENAQPAILTTSIASLRVLEKHFGFNMPQYALGHSLGEYTALTATQSFTLSDAVQLVRLRGQAMSKAIGEQQTTMSALHVRKNKLGELEDFIKVMQHNLSGNEHVSIANINSSFQVVISGTTQSVKHACQMLSAKKIIARSVDLPVSAPFHCALMNEAAMVMKDALKKVDIKMPSANVISNVTAKPYNSVEEISSRLVEQVVATVNWKGSIAYCKEQGIDKFVCFGPGEVLGNLLKKDYPSDTVLQPSFWIK